MWRAQFLSSRNLTSDIWEFRVSRPVGYDYLPGQYAAFICERPLFDPRGQSRTMSFTSHPNDDFLAFVTKIPDQASPYKTWLRQLQPGDQMILDAALGDLVLPRSAATPLVFVAGGIGMASYVSMLTEIELSQEARIVHLRYALRDQTEKLFATLLSQHPFASYEEYVAPQRLTPDAIVRTSPTPDTLYYLSGTERFVEGLRADLLALGLTDTQIAFDYFTGYTES